MKGHPTLTNERYANQQTASASLGRSPTIRATAASDPVTHTALIIASLPDHQSALG
jgi:hypothetical protein